jgi:hypothetical protein
LTRADVSTKHYTDRRASARRCFCPGCICQSLRDRWRVLP